MKRKTPHEGEPSLIDEGRTSPQSGGNPLPSASPSPSNSNSNLPSTSTSSSALAVSTTATAVLPIQSVTCSTSSASNRPLNTGATSSTDGSHNTTSAVLRRFLHHFLTFVSSETGQFLKNEHELQMVLCQVLDELQAVDLLPYPSVEQNIVDLAVVVFSIGWEFVSTSPEYRPGVHCILMSCKNLIAARVQHHVSHITVCTVPIPHQIPQLSFVWEKMCLLAGIEAQGDVFDSPDRFRSLASSREPFWSTDMLENLLTTRCWDLFLDEFISPSLQTQLVGIMSVVPYSPSSPFCLQLSSRLETAKNKKRKIRGHVSSSSLPTTSLTSHSLSSCLETEEASTTLSRLQTSSMVDLGDFCSQILALCSQLASSAQIRSLLNDHFKHLRETSRSETHHIQNPCGALYEQLKEISGAKEPCNSNSLRQKLHCSAYLDLQTASLTSLSAYRNRGLDYVETIKVPFGEEETVSTMVLVMVLYALQTAEVLERRTSLKKKIELDRRAQEEFHAALWSCMETTLALDEIRNGEFRDTLSRYLVDKRIAVAFYEDQCGIVRLVKDSLLMMCASDLVSHNLKLYIAQQARIRLMSHSKSGSTTLRVISQEALELWMEQSAVVLENFDRLVPNETNPRSEIDTNLPRTASQTSSDCGASSDFFSCRDGLSARKWPQYVFQQNLHPITMLELLVGVELKFPPDSRGASRAQPFLNTVFEALSGLHAILACAEKREKTLEHIAERVWTVLAYLFNGSFETGTISTFSIYPIMLSAFQPSHFYVVIRFLQTPQLARCAFHLPAKALVHQLMDAKFITPSAVPLQNILREVFPGLGSDNFRQLYPLNPPLFISSPTLEIIFDCLQLQFIISAEIQSPSTVPQFPMDTPKKLFKWILWALTCHSNSIKLPLDGSLVRLMIGLFYACTKDQKKTLWTIPTPWVLHKESAGLNLAITLAIMQFCFLNWNGPTQVFLDWMEETRVLDGEAPSVRQIFKVLLDSNIPKNPLPSDIPDQETVLLSLSSALISAFKPLEKPWTEGAIESVLHCTLSFTRILSCCKQRSPMHSWKTLFKKSEVEGIEGCWEPSVELIFRLCNFLVNIDHNKPETKCFEEMDLTASKWIDCFNAVATGALIALNGSNKNEANYPPARIVLHLCMYIMCILSKSCLVNENPARKKILVSFLEIQERIILATQINYIGSIKLGGSTHLEGQSCKELDWAIKFGCLGVQRAEFLKYMKSVLGMSPTQVGKAFDHQFSSSSRFSNYIPARSPASGFLSIEFSSVLRSAFFRTDSRYQDLHMAQWSYLNAIESAQVLLAELHLDKATTETSNNDLLHRLSRRLAYVHRNSFFHFASSSIELTVQELKKRVNYSAQEKIAEIEQELEFLSCCILVDSNDVIPEATFESEIQKCLSRIENGFEIPSDAESSIIRELQNLFITESDERMSGMNIFMSCLGLDKLSMNSTLKVLKLVASLVSSCSKLDKDGTLTKALKQSILDQPEAWFQALLSRMILFNAVPSRQPHSFGKNSPILVLLEIIDNVILLPENEVQVIDEELLEIATKGFHKALKLSPPLSLPTIQLELCMHINKLLDRGLKSSRVRPQALDLVQCIRDLCVTHDSPNRDSSSHSTKGGWFPVLFHVLQMYSTSSYISDFEILTGVDLSRPASFGRFRSETKSAADGSLKPSSLSPIPISLQIRRYVVHKSAQDSELETLLSEFQVSMKEKDEKNKGSESMKNKGKGRDKESSPNKSESTSTSATPIPLSFMKFRRKNSSSVPTERKSTGACISQEVHMEESEPSSPAHSLFSPDDSSSSSSTGARSRRNRFLSQYRSYRSYIDSLSGSVLDKTSNASNSPTSPPDSLKRKACEYFSEGSVANTSESSSTSRTNEGSTLQRGKRLRESRTSPDISSIDSKRKEKLCTFLLTGGDYVEQHWYYCYTCGLTDQRGCCNVCAKICHRGHDIVYARFSRFFCDCSKNSDGKVKCVAIFPHRQPSIPETEDGLLSDLKEIKLLAESGGLERSKNMDTRAQESNESVEQKPSAASAVAAMLWTEAFVELVVDRVTKLHAASWELYKKEIEMYVFHSKLRFRGAIQGSKKASSSSFLPQIKVSEQLPPALGRGIFTCIGNMRSGYYEKYHMDKPYINTTMNWPHCLDTTADGNVILAEGQYLFYVNSYPFLVNSARFVHNKTTWDEEHIFERSVVNILHRIRLPSEVQLVRCHPTQGNLFVTISCMRKKCTVVLMSEKGRIVQTLMEIKGDETEVESCVRDSEKLERLAPKSGPPSPNSIVVDVLWWESKRREKERKEKRFAAEKWKIQKVKRSIKTETRSELEEDQDDEGFSESETEGFEEDDLPEEDNEEDNIYSGDEDDDDEEGENEWSTSQGLFVDSFGKKMYRSPPVVTKRSNPDESASEPSLVLGQLIIAYETKLVWFDVLENRSTVRRITWRFPNLFVGNIQAIFPVGNEGIIVQTGLQQHGRCLWFVHTSSDMRLKKKVKASTAERLEEVLITERISFYVEGRKSDELDSGIVSCQCLGDISLGIMLLSLEDGSIGLFQFRLRDESCQDSLGVSLHLHHLVRKRNDKVEGPYAEPLYQRWTVLPSAVDGDLTVIGTPEVGCTFFLLRLLWKKSSRMEVHWTTSTPADRLSTQKVIGSCFYSGFSSFSLGSTPMEYGFFLAATNSGTFVQFHVSRGNYRSDIEEGDRVSSNGADKTEWIWKAMALHTGNEPNSARKKYRNAMYDVLLDQPEPYASGSCILDTAENLEAAASSSSTAFYLEELECSSAYSEISSRLSFSGDITQQHSLQHIRHQISPMNEEFIQFGAPYNAQSKSRVQHTFVIHLLSRRKILSAFRILFGKTSPAHVPREIQFFQRSITTNPHRCRWYDIVLTDEEIVLAKIFGGVSITLTECWGPQNSASSVGGSKPYYPILDALEVYMESDNLQDCNAIKVKRKSTSVRRQLQILSIYELEPIEKCLDALGNLISLHNASKSQKADLMGYNSAWKRLVAIVKDLKCFFSLTSLNSPLCFRLERTVRRIELEMKSITASIEPFPELDGGNQLQMIIKLMMSSSSTTFPGVRGSVFVNLVRIFTNFLVMNPVGVLNILDENNDQALSADRLSIFLFRIVRIYRTNVKLRNWKAHTVVVMYYLTKLLLLGTVLDWKWIPHECCRYVGGSRGGTEDNFMRATVIDEFILPQFVSGNVCVRQAIVEGLRSVMDFEWDLKENTNIKVCSVCNQPYTGEASAKTMVKVWHCMACRKFQLCDDCFHNRGRTSARKKEGKGFNSSAVYNSAESPIEEKQQRYTLPVTFAPGYSLGYTLFLKLLQVFDKKWGTNAEASSQLEKNLDFPEQTKKDSVSTLTSHQTMEQKLRQTRIREKRVELMLDVMDALNCIVQGYLNLLELGSCIQIRALSPLLVHLEKKLRYILEEWLNSPPERNPKGNLMPIIHETMFEPFLYTVRLFLLVLNQGSYKEILDGENGRTDEEGRGKAQSSTKANQNVSANHERLHLFFSLEQINEWIIVLFRMLERLKSCPLDTCEEGVEFLGLNSDWSEFFKQFSELLNENDMGSRVLMHDYMHLLFGSKELGPVLEESSLGISSTDRMTAVLADREISRSYWLKTLRRPYMFAVMYVLELLTVFFVRKRALRTNFHSNSSKFDSEDFPLKEEYCGILCELLTKRGMIRQFDFQASCVQLLITIASSHANGIWTRFVVQNKLQEISKLQKALSALSPQGNEYSSYETRESLLEIILSIQKILKKNGKGFCNGDTDGKSFKILVYCMLELAPTLPEEGLESVLEILHEVLSPTRSLTNGDFEGPQLSSHLIAACVERLLVDSEKPLNRAKSAVVLSDLIRWMNANQKLAILEMIQPKMKTSVERGTQSIEFVKFLAQFMGVFFQSAKQETQSCEAKNDSLIDKYVTTTVENTLKCISALKMHAERDNISAGSENSCLNCFPRSVSSVSVFQPSTAIVREMKFTQNAFIFKFEDCKRIEAIRMTIHDPHHVYLKEVVVYISVNPLEHMKTLRNPESKGKKMSNVWARLKSFSVKKQENTVLLRFLQPFLCHGVKIECSSMYPRESAKTVKFRYRRAGSYLNSTRDMNTTSIVCPRCSRMVEIDTKSGICHHCGEVAYQCRQCRHINYNNLDSFLCIECGYCRYGKFRFEFKAARTTRVIPFRSREIAEYYRTQLNLVLEREQKIHERTTKLALKVDIEVRTAELRKLRCPETERNQDCKEISDPAKPSAACASPVDDWLHAWKLRNSMQHQVNYLKTELSRFEWKHVSRKPFSIVGEIREVERMCPECAESLLEGYIDILKLFPHQVVSQPSIQTANFAEWLSILPEFKPMKELMGIAFSLSEEHKILSIGIKITKNILRVVFQELGDSIQVYDKRVWRRMTGWKTESGSCFSDISVALLAFLAEVLTKWKRNGTLESFSPVARIMYDYTVALCHRIGSIGFVSTNHELGEKILVPCIRVLQCLLDIDTPDLNSSPENKIRTLFKHKLCRDIIKDLGVVCMNKTGSFSDTPVWLTMSQLKAVSYFNQLSQRKEESRTLAERRSRWKAFVSLDEVMWIVRLIAQNPCPQLRKAVLRLICSLDENARWMVADDISMQLGTAELNSFTTTTKQPTWVIDIILYAFSISMEGSFSAQIWGYVKKLIEGSNSSFSYIAAQGFFTYLFNEVWLGEVEVLFSTRQVTHKFRMVLRIVSECTSCILGLVENHATRLHAFLKLLRSEYLYPLITLRAILSSSIHEVTDTMVKTASDLSKFVSEWAKETPVTESEEKEYITERNNFLRSNICLLNKVVNLMKRTDDYSFELKSPFFFSLSTCLEILQCMNEMLDPQPKELDIWFLLRPCTAQEDFFPRNLPVNPLHIRDIPKKVEVSSLRDQDTTESSSSNDVSQSEAKEKELTVRDLRRKVASDLEFTDATELIEFLSKNRILSLDLPLRLVFHKVMSERQASTQRSTDREDEEEESMERDTSNDGDSAKEGKLIELGFRLIGINGEATEERIESIDDLFSKEGEQSIKEKLTQCSREIANGEGIKSFVQLIEFLLEMEESKNEFMRVDQVSTKKTISPACCLILEALKILERCSQFELNREAMFVNHIPGILVRLLVSSTGRFLVRYSTSVSNVLLHIMESVLVVGSNSQMGSIFETKSAMYSRDEELRAPEKDLEVLLNELTRLQSLKIPRESIEYRLVHTFSRLSAYLTYGKRSNMERLIAFYEECWKLDTCENTLKDGENEESKTEEQKHRRMLMFRLQCLTDSFTCLSMKNPLGKIVLSYFLEKGFISRIVEGIAAGFIEKIKRRNSLNLHLVGNEGISEQDEDENIRKKEAWKLYCSRPSLPLNIQSLIGLLKGNSNEEIYSALLGNYHFINALHALEDDPSCKEVGILAETLLSSLLKSSMGESKLGESHSIDCIIEGREYIQSIRKESREERKLLALEQRERILRQMGLTPSPKNTVRSTSKGKMKENETSSKEYLICMVCHNTLHADSEDCLGIYAYKTDGEISIPQNNKIAIPVERGIAVSTSLSCFNLIHLGCHDQAVKADRSFRNKQRSEWEGAELRNSRTPCNSLFPVFTQNMPFSVYASNRDRYFQKQLSCTATKLDSCLNVKLYELSALLLRIVSKDFTISRDGSKMCIGSRVSNMKYFMFGFQCCFLLLKESEGGSQEDMLRPTIENYASKMNAFLSCVRPIAKESDHEEISEQSKFADASESTFAYAFLSLLLHSKATWTSERQIWLLTSLYYPVATKWKASTKGTSSRQKTINCIGAACLIDFLHQQLDTTTDGKRLIDMTKDEFCSRITPKLLCSIAEKAVSLIECWHSRESSSTDDVATCINRIINEQFPSDAKNAIFIAKVKNICSISSSIF